jgi:hypothetical protein
VTDEGNDSNTPLFFLQELHIKIAAAIKKIKAECLLLTDINAGIIR